MRKPDLSIQSEWGRPKTLTALIVDVHGFSAMCADPRAEEVSRFMHDTLVGTVELTESHGGLIANTMGDGILSLFEAPESAFEVAMKVVVDFGNANEFLLSHQDEIHPEPYVEKGLRCRCAIETGPIEYYPLKTADDTLVLWVGVPINYAARIIDAEESRHEGAINTIAVGPVAYEVLRNRYDGFYEPIPVNTKGIKYCAHPFDTVSFYDL